MTDTNDRPGVAFGFRQVGESEKQGLVNDVFSKVAERYDQMNDLMSGGLHRLWKDDLVAMLNPPRGSARYDHLDVAGGTGDVAFRIVRAGGPNVRVTVADISPEMVGEGRKRAAADGLLERCSFSVGNAEKLAFPDKSFDGYTIAFGIRNVTHIDQALKEAYRVLKPGGRFLCLEFSTPAQWLRPFYGLWSRTAIPALGALVSGRREAYRYLVESIRRFPDQREFAAMIERAGFVDIDWRNFSFGIAAVHRARKASA